MTKSYYMYFAMILSVSALVSGPVKAQQIPDILTQKTKADSLYLPDFSYAGYKFGEEAVPHPTGKIIDVTKYGAVADDDDDDTRAIQKALKAADEVSGPVILKFPKGKFIITEVLPIERSNIALRGAGRGLSGTTLQFPRPLRMAGDGGRLDQARTYLKANDKRQKEPRKNLNVGFSEYSWSGGFIWVGRPGMLAQRAAVAPSTLTLKVATNGIMGRRGETHLKVDNPSGLKVGQRIMLNWRNAAGENGPLIKALYGDDGLSVGSRHWEDERRPIVVQRTQIKSILGDKIVLADSLLHDVSSDLPADIELWQPLEGVGIQDFRFEFPNAPNYGHHTEEGFNGIYLTDVADSWVKSLTIVNADSGIIVTDSGSTTISDIRTEGERRAHYAVQVSSSHNILAERLQIFNPVTHSLSFNTQSTRSVYKDSEVFVEPVLDQHAGANHQNLFDNVTLFFKAKRSKGDAVYKVFDGSGAPYWQPGHGGFNTTWNLKLFVESGAAPDETVIVQGLDEGPMGRIVGISGNRNFELDYRPKPYTSHINERVLGVPSLYDYQLHRRLQKGE